MVSNVLTHSRFSFKVRMKRSATPLPSGSRMKEGDASIPRLRFRPGNRRTYSWSHDRDAASIHAPHRERWLRSTDAPPDAPAPGDRKSTRLNSSHLVISYA